MPRTLSSSRWMKSPPHTFGLVVAALVLAAPSLVRAEEAPLAVDVDLRVHLLEGGFTPRPRRTRAARRSSSSRTPRSTFSTVSPLLGLVLFGYLFVEFLQHGGALVRLALLLLVGSGVLSGCCQGLKEAIRGYGEIAASAAETRTELIAGCKTANTETDPSRKQSALDACDARDCRRGRSEKSALELASIK